MRVTFTWTANTDGATGYKIYAGTATGTYNASNSPRDVGNVTESYFDVLTFNAPMFFALTAYNATGESSFSTEISQTFTRPITLFKR